MSGRYQFGTFVLDHERCELRRNDERVALQPKPMALLRYLLAQRERVVSARELLEVIWPDVHVERHTLVETLRSLRRALGDTDHAVIRTERGHGYRFAAEVRLLALDPATARRRGPDRRAPAALVERHAQLGALREALDAARGGAGRLTAVLGPAGIGKTRLLDALADEARRSGVRMHAGSCHWGEGAPALWPWIQIAEDCIQSARGGPAQRAAWLREAGPALAALLGAQAEPLPPDGIFSSPRSRFEIARGLVRLLAIAAREQPRLVTFEDLHWSDPESLAVLEITAHALDRLPVLLVVTLRTDEWSDERHALQGALARVARSRGFERLELGGLSADGVREVLQHHSAGPVSETFGARVCEASAGNPFFVIEFGRLHAQAHASGAALEGPGLPIPSGVREVLELQLRRHSEACRKVLTLAAVCGDAFSCAILTAIADEPGECVLDALAEAEAASLIVESATAPGRYAFAHSLWRELLYEAIPKAAVRRMHLRLACTIESLHARDLDRHLDALAHHFSEGAPVGGAERAVHYARLAAERSKRLWAMHNAAESYDRALRSLACLEVGSPRLEAELRIARSLALRHVPASWSGLAQTAEDLDHCAKLARDARAPDLAARALTERIGLQAEPYWLVPALGPVPEAWLARSREELHAALAEISETDEDSRTRVQLCLAHVCAFDGQIAERDAWMRRAQASARTLRSPSLEVLWLMARWIFAEHPARVDERRAIAEQIQRVDWPPSGPGALDGDRYMVFSTTERGELQAADALVEATLERAEKHLIVAPELWVWRAMRALMRGRLQEADEALRAMSELDGVWVLSAYYSQSAWLALVRGRPENARPALEWAAQALSRWALPRLLLALCELQSGAEVKAREQIQQALSDRLHTLPLDQNWLGTLALAAEGVEQLHAREHAAWLYEALCPYEGRTAFLSWMMLCVGSVSRALGLLAATLGRRETALAHLESACGELEKLEAPALLVQARFDLGRILAAHGRRGERERGRALLCEVQVEAERMGLSALGVRAARAHRASQ